MSDVGLFQAGLSISSMSINMVFVAIANDYFPKLSKDCDNKIDMNATVNSQMFVATLLIAPILAFMIVFSSLLIKMFLSSDFFEIETFIHWILFGSFLWQCHGVYIMFH
ncbi:oligosaccharide flippase family protein [Bacteroides sp. CR5/BHMF/2]|nr:oligosaccharide flippase family protein [Bacteroides sp. CR5/BHMF/2]